VFVEPGAAPLLPTLSVAVQTTLCVPSPETLRVAVAVGVPIPDSLLRLAPVQLIDITFEASLAVTVPVTGELLNQPLLPSGDGKVTNTEGGVVSGALTVCVRESRVMIRTLESTNATLSYSRQ